MSYFNKMGEASDWESLGAQLERMEQADEEAARCEEKRREAMYKAGNFEHSSFILGDTVEEHEKLLGVCTVIGLPSKSAAPQAKDRPGCRGTVWIKRNDTGERVWRNKEHLRKVGIVSPQRSSPRLEQNALRGQRAIGAASNRKRVLEIRAENDAVELSSDDPDDTDKEADIPELASHERNRKPRKKPKTKTGAFHCSGVTTKSTGVPHAQRLKEFPDCGLVISCGELWCAACKKGLQNLKTTIATHVTSASHKLKLDKLVKRGSADEALGDNLSNYFKAHPNEKGVRQACSTDCPPTGMFCLARTHQSATK